MKKLACSLCTFLFLIYQTAFADEAPDMFLYIQPLEYTHAVSLWNPYQNYWVTQGELVEPVAIEKLRQTYGNVAMCEGNQSGKALIWLQPNIFYNPQVQLFYGELTAKIYTGIGELVGTYVGESRVHGLLNGQAEVNITQAYSIAMDDLIVKMRADVALQNISEQQPNNGAETPCSMVTLLPTPKFRTTSF